MKIMKPNQKKNLVYFSKNFKKYFTLYIYFVNIFNNFQNTVWYLFFDLRKCLSYCKYLKHFLSQRIFDGVNYYINKFYFKCRLYNWCVIDYFTFYFFRNLWLDHWYGPFMFVFDLFLIKNIKIQNIKHFQIFLYFWLTQTNILIYF